MVFSMVAAIQSASLRSLAVSWICTFMSTVAACDGVLPPQYLRRRPHDRVRAAEAPVQADHPGAGIVFGDARHEPGIRSAEPVDRLVGIADHEKVRAVTARQQLYKFILRRVDVLELVHQNPAVPIPVLGEDLGVLPEEWQPAARYRSARSMAFAVLSSSL